MPYLTAIILIIFTYKKNKTGKTAKNESNNQCHRNVDTSSINKLSLT